MRYLCHIHILLFAFLYAACSNSANREIIRQEPENKVTAPYYTSAFPDKDISDNLSRIQQSVVRITSTGYYSSYLVRNRDLSEQDIKSVDVSQIAEQSRQTEESTAGTAIVLARSSQRVLLLTCAHVVQNPDTVVKYRQESNIPPKTYVESVTIKRRQTNFALNLPSLSTFRVLASDHSKDLALLEINIREHDNVDVDPLQLTMGNAKNLRLASVIYVMGYPKGYRMVTRSIVSDPDRTGNGDFVADALFNRGISGGVIVATKDHYNSFEWVGMSCSAAASNNFVIVPDMNTIDYEESLQPYTGDIFVEKRTELVYGITHGVSTNRIYTFLQEHQDKLRGLRLRVDRSVFQ